MATDISEYIDAINTAVRGEEVRDAIIAVLQLINKNNNAYTLDGHGVSYFATKEDLDKVYPLDTTPIEGSTRGVTSDGLYTYIWERMGGVINRLLGETSTASITDRLQELVDIKKDIKYAIRNKDVEVTDETKFSEYADKIKEISGSNIDLSELSLTDPKDHEYDAGTGKGYNPVKVKINFSSRLLKKTISGASLNEDPKQDTTFKPENEPEYESAEKDNKPVGYSEITVNVGDKIVEMEPIEVDASDYGLERVYNASDDGVFGWSKVTVRVVENQNPHTVTFYKDINKSEKLDEQTQVPHHGVARYNGPDINLKAPPGQVFKEWNPSPTDVVRDMDVFAVFEKQKEIMTGQISNEDWQNLSSTGGANIPIGSWKLIYIEGFQGEHISLGEGLHPLLIQKVAAGEAGSVSTWVCRTPLQVAAEMFYYDDRVLQQGGKFVYSYADSEIRKFLNGELLNAINAASDSLGERTFSGAIKAVTKVTKSVKSGTAADGNWSVLVNTETKDSVWLLSACELGSPASSGLYSSEHLAGQPFITPSGDRGYTYVNSNGLFPDLIDADSSINALCTYPTWLRSGIQTSNINRLTAQIEGDNYVFYGANNQRVSTISKTNWGSPSLNNGQIVAIDAYMLLKTAYQNTVGAYIPGLAYSYVLEGIDDANKKQLPGSATIGDPKKRTTYPIMFGFCTGGN